MDQTVTFEAFESYLLNAVQSHNQANRMQGSQAYYSIVKESGIMGDPQSAILVWTDPAKNTEGYAPFYGVGELFTMYSELSREGQRGFFTDVFSAVSSNVSMSVLEDILLQKQKNLTDKEFLLAHVFPAVIQFEGNENHLENMPNRSAGETDLRIYYYVDVVTSFDKGDIRHNYIVLTDDIIEKANQGPGRKLNEETIYRAARTNISGHTKVEGGLERLTRQICESEGISVEDGMSRLHPPKVESLYYISAPDLPNGAAAAFTLCGVDEVEAKWGNCPAYFVPLSVDEVCVRLTNGVTEMQKYAFEQERRNLDLPPEERLSDSIYYYEPKQKRLTIESRGSAALYAPEQSETLTEISSGAHFRGGR